MGVISFLVYKMKNPFKHKTLEDFYNELEYKKQFRFITIENYKKVLKKIFKDLGTLKVTKKQAENWMLNMQKEKFSASHINNIAIYKVFPWTGTG